MNKYKILSKYIQSSKLDKNTIRLFVEELYEEVVKELSFFNEKDVSLKIINSKKKGNGYIKVLKIKGYHQYYIYINIYPFFDSDESKKIRLFNLYMTILHEIEHINIFYNNKASEYLFINALFESMKELNESYIVSVIKRLFYNGSLKDQIKRYQTHSSELWCIRQSMERAYDDMKEFFSLDEKNMIETMCKGIRFVSRELEIGYNSNGQPYNKFVDMLKTCKYFQQKGVKDFDKSQYINILYEGCCLKKIENLYAEKTEDTLYDELLLKYFLYIEQDYKNIFDNNTDFKLYMENILNVYCDRIVEYFENRDKCELFIDINVLEDNEEVIIKNVKRIISCLRDCNLNHISGGVITG